MCNAFEFHYCSYDCRCHHCVGIPPAHSALCAESTQPTVSIDGSDNDIHGACAGLHTKVSKEPEWKHAGTCDAYGSLSKADAPEGELDLLVTPDATEAEEALELPGDDGRSDLHSSHSETIGTLPVIARIENQSHSLQVHAHCAARSKHIASSNRIPP